RGRDGPRPRVRRLAARHGRTPPDRRVRHDGVVERRRVPPAARLSRSSAASAQPRAAAEPHAGSRAERLRPLDRPARESAAPAPPRRGPRAALHQDRPQRRIRVRGDGPPTRAGAVRPRSLFGRVALILFVGLVVAHALSFWLILRAQGQTALAMMINYLPKDI